MNRVQTLRSVLAVTLFFGLSPAGVQSSLGVDLTVELIPEFDQFGSQIETIQVFQRGTDEWMMFGIYDTGASVVTIAAIEQTYAELFGSPIPIKVPDGAVAQGIGGDLVGDVSQPGTIMADGLHVFPLDSLDALLNMNPDFSQAAAVTGVQTFVGNMTGSAMLPTITGTPIHNPSARHPNGSAARIEMQAYELDFGELFPGLGFDGIVINLPDLYIEDPGTRLEAKPTTSAPVRVLLSPLGEDNHEDPGDTVTASPSPVQIDVDLFRTDPNDLGQTYMVADQRMLFDTGAQLSIIEPDIAVGLGIDLLDPPETTIDVQGAAGVAIEVPGYTIGGLTLPRDDDADGSIDGTLRLENVPVYVLDLGIEGLDGILGMNLFNTAESILYDPFDPAGASVSFTFLNERTDGLGTDELAALGQLSLVAPGLVDAILGHNLPGFEIVPEPSALALLATGGLLLLVWRLRRRRGG